MKRYLTIDDVDVSGKTTLVRSDLNVPLTDGIVGDDFRLRASLPTIERLRAQGARVVLASHLGRPVGIDPAFSLAPVSARLGELGGFEIIQLDGLYGPDIERAINAVPAGSVLALENTRFDDGETSNDPVLAAGLASLCDLFVNDAFGTAHRAHASTTGIAEHVLSVAGLLLVSELQAFSTLLEDPPRPFTVVLGGAKVSDKLGVIKALLPKVDMMLIGGGMCFTLLSAEGFEIGNSLFEEGMEDEVAQVLRGPYGDRVVTPSDIVVGGSFAEDTDHQVVARNRVPDDQIGLDIGPTTATEFARVIAGSGSVFWNGPMGVFEWEAFSHGTEQVARALVGHQGFSVVGGGDSVAALRQLGLEDAPSHLSTGGGAGLELLEGKVLPGIAALERWVDGS
ncbi:MAG: phosphoglycerate kinase [Acidimicrobiia bacterium]|nr:phosphoglycerate kinase [Acidimicrobiia bacterium]